MMLKKTLIEIFKLILWITFIAVVITTTTLAAVMMIYLVNGDSTIFSQIKIKLPNYQLNIGRLHEMGKISLVVILLTLLIVSTLEAYVIRLLIRILQKIESQHPFSDEVAKTINKLVKFTCLLAIVSILTTFLSELLIQKEMNIHIGIGSSNFNLIIFSGVIYLIGEVYKKGLNLQKEQDLTI